MTLISVKVTSLGSFFLLILSILKFKFRFILYIFMIAWCISYLCNLPFVGVVTTKKKEKVHVTCLCNAPQTFDGLVSDKTFGLCYA